MEVQSLTKTNLFDKAIDHLKKAGAIINKREVSLCYVKLYIVPFTKTINHLSHAYAILDDMNNFNRDVAMLLLDHALQLAKKHGFRDKCNVCTICLNPTSKLWIKNFQGMSEYEIKLYHKWWGYCMDCRNYAEALSNHPNYKKEIKNAKKILDHQIPNLRLDMNLKYPVLNKKYEKISVMRDFINGLFTEKNEHYAEILEGMENVEELCNFVV